MAFYIGHVGVWDASATDSLNCKGYSGMGSDGEYIYYSPYNNGSAYHGVVLRQKIYSIFKDSGTWEAYDAGSVDGMNCKGFFGNPVFDGRYMYFVPHNNGAPSGVVLRYDTTKPFKSASSWSAYGQTESHVVGTDNNLWRLTEAGWSRISARAIKKISVGADGTIAAIDNSTGEGLIWVNSDWESIGGYLKEIAVENANKIYGIGGDDNIWLYSGGWSMFATGPFLHLAVGYDGTIGAVTTANYPYIYVDVSWEYIAGMLYEIAVFNRNEVHGIGTDYHTWKWVRGAGWSSEEASTAINHICISAEGELYAVDTSTNCLRFNGSSYDTITGYAIDCSCVVSRKYACGYSGAIFEGKYIYFVPYNNGAYHGKVLRLDTERPFKFANSWEVCDVGSLAGGTAKGYWGAVVVDNFIYFSPYKATVAHGQILRYDVTQPFKSAGAWTVFNAANVSTNCKGFGVPCTDGRFIYFPNAMYNLTLRYDTALPFTDTASYVTFDILDLSDDENAQHNACCMQGHYIAFAPSRYTILVYDLEKPFSDPGSWAERDVFYAEGLTEWGFIGTYSDPNYVYFAPYSRGSTYHGQVLRGRVDPCPVQVFPSPSEENLTEYMLDDGTPFGGYLSVSSSRVTAIGINSTTPSLLFQDYEKDCFDGFEITFDIKMSSLRNVLGGDGDASFCLFSLGNRHSAYDEYPSSSQDDPCVTFFAIWDDGGELESLWIYLEKESTTGTGYEIAIGTIYYCTISRPDGGTTVTLKIYSDAERTILLATLTESGFASAQKWRFLYAMRGTGHASTEPQATYYLENLNVVSY